MAEDLKKQQEKEIAEKKKALESRIPKLEIDGLNQGDLEKKVRDLYSKVCRLEEEKYDWEVKIRKQDYEINDLTIKLNDQGKFLKPVLKKVSMTENKLAKIDKEKVRNALGFREQLKSTGQSKFTLDEKEELKKPEWGQDALKHKGDDEKDEEEKEEEHKEEEEEEEEEEE